MTIKQKRGKYFLHAKKVSDKDCSLPQFKVFYFMAGKHGPFSNPLKKTADETFKRSLRNSTNHHLEGSYDPSRAAWVHDKRV